MAMPDKKTLSLLKQNNSKRRPPGPAADDRFDVQLSDFGWAGFKVIFSTHLLYASPHNTPRYTQRWHIHTCTTEAHTATNNHPSAQIGSHKKKKKIAEEFLLSAIHSLLWKSRKSTSRMKWSDAKEQKVLSHSSSLCLCLQCSSTVWSNLHSHIALWYIDWLYYYVCHQITISIKWLTAALSLNVSCPVVHGKSSATRSMARSGLQSQDELKLIIDH